MDATAHILDSMVYDLMSALPSESLLGEQEVSAKRGSSLNRLLYFRLESAHRSASADL